jgi:hypothetical protein
MPLLFGKEIASRDSDIGHAGDLELTELVAGVTRGLAQTARVPKRAMRCLLPLARQNSLHISSL